MFKRVLIFMLIILGMISGCTMSKAGSLPTPTHFPATFPTVAPTNAAALPAIPTVAVVPTSSASPTPFVTFEVEPLVENLKLRVNPGYLFDALMLLQPGDPLTVQGKAPGGEWIYVQTADETKGWVFAQLLKSAVNLQQIPVIQPENVQVVKGRVADVNGTPIDGVQFAFTQGTEDNPTRTDAQTDANGEFFAFFPLSASGDWKVAYVAVACTSTVWQDGVCSQYKTGYTGTVTPETTSITLPKTETLVFLWK
jgi:hypothetical protein